MKFYIYFTLTFCYSPYCMDVIAYGSSCEMPSTSGGYGSEAASAGLPVNFNLPAFATKFVDYVSNTVSIFSTTVKNLQKILKNARQSSDHEVINHVWANIILQYPPLYQVFAERTQDLATNLKSSPLYVPPNLALSSSDLNNLLNQLQLIASLSANTSATFTTYQGMLAGYTTNHNFQFPNNNLNFPLNMAMELDNINLVVSGQNQQIANIFSQFSATVANEINSYQISPNAIKFINSLAVCMNAIPKELSTIGIIWAKASQEFGTQSTSDPTTNVFAIPMPNMASIIRVTTQNLLPHYAKIGTILQKFSNKIAIW